MTFCQYFAVGLLICEAINGIFWGTHRVPPSYGFTRLADTIVWASILYWGGFFH